MAASYHVRSNSFPSRPNPLFAQVDDQLSRLRSFETASTSSLSSSISQKLNGLQDLHEGLEKLLQLPVTQQALCQEQNKKVFDELLDGSLKLLDVCNVAKDALLQTKESLKEIQSIQRRKRGDLTMEVKKYLASMKSFKKSFQRVLKSLKTTDNKDNRSETLTTLRDVEEVTATVFDSLLRFISGSDMLPKPCSKWSLVSKFVKAKRVPCEVEETNANEFARVNSAFHFYVDKKSDKVMKAKDMQSLETCIQELEEGLESLFRCLIKFRVSILNILGN